MNECDFNFFTSTEKRANFFRICRLMRNELCEILGKVAGEQDERIERKISQFIMIFFHYFIM